MKRLILILIFLLAFSTISFGEGIDESYIDLIFNNFDKYDEATKKENAELLDVFFSSNIGLDILCSEIIRTKADSLEAYNITPEQVEANIEALKTWSVADRKEMLAAGVDGNRTKVIEINNKYKEQATAIAAAFISQAKPVVSGYVNTFKDTSTHWSKDYIQFLNERAIISGRSKEAYEPDGNIKRSEIVTVVMNLVIEEPESLPQYEGTVDDIETGAWYDSYMQRAYTLKVIKENYKNELLPEDLATREEVVDVLIKTLNAMHVEITEEMKVYQGGFVDLDSVSSEYKESMIIAINLGFISGKGQGRIAPEDLITRGETAVVIKKLYEYILGQL